VVDYRLAGLQKMQIVNFEAETLKTDEVLYMETGCDPAELDFLHTNTRHHSNQKVGLTSNIWEVGVKEVSACS